MCGKKLPAMRAVSGFGTVKVNREECCADELLRKCVREWRAGIMDKILV